MHVKNLTSVKIYFQQKYPRFFFFVSMDGHQLSPCIYVGLNGYTDFALMITNHALRVK